MLETGPNIVRYKVMNTNQSLRGYVYDPLEADWNTKAGDIPTLQLKWSRAVPEHRVLATSGLVAVEFQRADNPGSWWEPKDARFILKESNGDLKDDTGAVTSKMVGVGALLADAIISNTSLEVEMKDRYYGVTAGTAVRSIIDTEKANGYLSNISTLFTAARDTFQRFWPETRDWEFDFGQDLLGVMREIYDEGGARFFFSGMSMGLASLTDTQDGVDKSSTITIPTDALSAMPYREVYGETVTDATVFGDHSSALPFVASFTNPAAGTGDYGKKAAFVDNNAVVNSSQARLLADQEFRRASLESSSYTYEWVVSSQTTDLVAGRDFSVGDFVTAEIPGRGQQRVHVVDTSMTTDNDGVVSCFFTVGSLKNDPVIRAVKKTTNNLKETYREATAPKPPKAGSVKMDSFDPALRDGWGVPKEGSVDASKLTPALRDGWGVPKDGSIDASKLTPELRDKINSGGGGGGTPVAFDQTPIKGSSNAVTSNGIYEALQQRQPRMTFDSKPTTGSQNPVTSDGVRRAIQEAIDAIPPPSAETELKLRLGSEVHMAVLNGGFDSAVFRLVGYQGSGKKATPVWRFQLRKTTTFRLGSVGAPREIYMVSVDHSSNPNDPPIGWSGATGVSVAGVMSSATTGSFSQFDPFTVGARVTKAACSVNLPGSDEKFRGGVQLIKFTFGSEVDTMTGPGDTGKTGFVEGTWNWTAYVPHQTFRNLTTPWTGPDA